MRNKKGILLIISAAVLCVIVTSVITYTKREETTDFEEASFTYEAMDSDFSNNVSISEEIYVPINK